ncbi:putative plant disease resistance response protein [Rosa chinensis]|uniref:Dirigent protein n=1 Tax=Rosa chinensis TaxID=74649 RepID=A0A2P6SJZ4_ROSCH|nr:dirigent protein 25 [Rosa chinensis]PRQ59002.1 putative plant disease resistance response protein [Rosa chinensis]
MAMLTIACSLILLITTTINHSFAAARSLSNSNPSHPHNHHHKLTFLMRDVLMNVTQPSSKTKPATTKVTSPQLPFSKPLGLFPPNGGVPISEINPMHTTTSPVSGVSTQTLDLSSIGLFFPASATLQELEFGEVTVIDEDIFETFTSGYGSLVIGKAQGIYVASSEDGSSHMMAMTAHFANSKFKDGLRLFGVHRRDMHDESHVAVIGGIGKYVGANGYATVKTVKTEEAASKMLKLNVYLS